MYPRLDSLKPKVQAHWNAAPQTLEGRSSTVGPVAFSPDGKLLPRLLVSNIWVLENERNILAASRLLGICFSYLEQKLVVGHSSGRISFFGFKQRAKLGV